MKILICEDTKASLEEWTQSIGEAIPAAWTQPRALSNHAALYREIFARLIALRDGVSRPEEWCELDGADIVVVDYDLEMYGEDKARHTGEELARFCRLVSDVGYVVVMNQYNRTADFDLRLAGRPNSYADRNIAAKAVHHPGLWRDVAAGEFRPWEWDDIGAIVAARRALIDRLTGHMDHPVVAHIGMPNSVASSLPDDAYEFLNRWAADEAELTATTFRSFLQQQIESKDVDALIKASPRRAATLAVARTSKWLTRLVLGPQDILVDIPHLLERLPFLMAHDFGDPSDKESWKRVPSAGLEAVDRRLHDECAFGGALAWTGRAALWWPLVDRHPVTAELRRSSQVRSTPDLVFVEDRSIFVDADEAEEFRSDFRGRFAHRWSWPLEGLTYEPRRRLLEA